MRCPRCHHNHRKRSGSKCSGCGRQFVFYPNTATMSDGRFAGLIRMASAGDSYYFTRNQLYVALLQRMRRPSSKHPFRRYVIEPFSYLLFLGLFWGILADLTGHDVLLQPILLYLIMTIAFKVNVSNRSRKPVSRGAFRQFIDEWIELWYRKLGGLRE